MWPDVRVTVFDAFASQVLCRDAVTTGDLALDNITYEDTPSGCGAGSLALGLTLSEITARGYWRGYNIVEISTADNILEQAVTTNILTNSDSLSGWTTSGGALGTGGPGGANDYEVTGTGSPSGTDTISSIAITVTPGQTISFSAWVDPSHVTTGSPNLLIGSSSSFATVYASHACSGSAGRFSVSYTVGAGTSTVYVGFSSNNATIANAQKLKFSQPMLEVNASASAWYVPSGSSTRIYLDSETGFDPSTGEDTQQAYFWDGTTLTMLVPVAGVGTDAASGQPYITCGTPMSTPGNPTSIPAYTVGTYVGRRRYAGRIIRRSRPNQKEPKATVTLVGWGNTLSAYGTFTIDNQDAGTAAYECVAQFASRWTFLTINQSNFPTVGWSFNGTQTAYSCLQMVSDILASVPSGDLWVMRIGHDRTPRLMKLYTSATNIYTYNVALPQGVTNFEPLTVEIDDEDVSQLYNAVQVTANNTNANQSQNVQPAAIIDDSTSIALYSQVDAQPVTQTGLSTQTDCVNFGTSLLNQYSLARANDQFRVYVRNESDTGAPLANMPAGLSNGDVVRGVDCVTLTRFDDTGTVRNMVPDSEFIYGPGQTDAFTWNASSGVTVDLEAGNNSSNALAIAGTGAPQTLTAQSLAIDVAPGLTYTVAGWINATHVTSGSPFIAVYPIINGSVSATPVTGSEVLQSGGTSSKVTATFTIPASPGYAQVVVGLSSNAATTTSGQNLLFSQPEFEPGSFSSSYVQNAAAPNVFGLVASAKTTITPAGDRWQDIKFSAIEPDWNAAIAEKGRALANAILLNSPPSVSISSYCVSAGAYPSGGLSITGLVVTTPAFLAIFAQTSPVVSVATGNFTLQPTATNWVWLTPSGSWVVNQNPETVSGDILYGIFQTSSTTVIGWKGMASIGVVQVGVGNINVASGMPTPTCTSVTVANSSTPTTLAADIAATLTVTNVPQNGSAWGLAYYYRTTGTSTGWVPYGEETFTGMPTPPASITMAAFVFGQLQNGISYDFAVGFVGLAGYGPLTIIKTALTANSIVVTTPYMIGTTSPTPTVTSVTVTNQTSANGITAAVNLVFTLTNQPTDGSLSRISIWYRVHGSANWSFYTSIGVPGLPTPSASQAYNETLADLANGQNFDFGVTYENAQGQDSATVGVIYSNWAAQALNLPASALPSVPSGTSMTATGSVTGYQGAGAGAFYAAYTVTPVITSSLPFIDWGIGFAILAKINNSGTLDGDTNVADYQLVGQIATNTWTSGALTGVTSALGAGNSYQLAVAAIAQNGQYGPLVPFAIASNQSIAGGSIGTIPGNMVVDSGFAASNFNSSGVGSNNPYWAFEFIDGLSFQIAQAGSNEPNSSANWPTNLLRIVSGDSGKNCQALSEVISVTPGCTYYFSAFFGGGHSTGSMPYAAIVNTGWSLANPSAGGNVIYQQISPVSPVNQQTVSNFSSPWVCPSGVTQVCFLFNQNGNTIGGGDSLYMGAPFFSMQSGPYVAGPTTKSSAATSAPVTDGNSSGGGPVNSAGDTPGTNAHLTMSTGVQRTVESTVDAFGNYLKAGVVSRLAVTPVSGNTVNGTNLVVNPTGAVCYATNNFASWSRFGTPLLSWANDNYGGGRFITAAASMTNGQFDGLEQSINVDAGQTLTISAIGAMSGTIPTNVNLIVDVLNSSSSILASLSWNVAGTSLKAVTFTAPGSGPITVRLYLYNQSGSTQALTGVAVAISQIQVEYGVQPSAYVDHQGTIAGTNVNASIIGDNLVVNGNNGNGSGSPAPATYGWTNQYGGTGSIVTSGGSYSVNSQTYNSIGLNVTGAGGGVYQIIPVIPGQTYTYCVLMFSATGSQAGIWIGNSTITSVFNSTLGNPVGSVGSFYQGATTGTSFNLSALQTVTNTWQTFAGTFTVPAGVSQAAVLLQNHGTSGPCYFQGVQVVQGTRLQDYFDYEPNPISGNILGAAVLQKNLILNGNNSNGLATRAPQSYGWNNLWQNGTVTSAGSYVVNSVTLASMQVYRSASGNGPGVYQVINVVPGQTYTYCTLMYSSSGGQAAFFIGTPNFATQLNLSPGVPLGALGNFYSANSGAHVGYLQTSLSIWEVFYGTFVVPAGCNQVWVLLQNEGNPPTGVVYFQGVQIIQGNRLQDYIDQEDSPAAFTSSSGLNEIPNSLANLSTDIALAATGGTTGNTTISIWITSASGNSENSNGGQYPCWVYPDGSGAISPTPANCGSSGSPLHTFTGLTTGHGYYFIIGYNVSSGQFTNYTTIYSSQPTQAQVTAVLGDGTILAVVSTIDTANAIAPGNGNQGFHGGGAGHNLY